MLVNGVFEGGGVRGIALAGSGIRARYGLPRRAASQATVLTVPVDGDLDFDLGRTAAKAVFDRGRRAAIEQLEYRGAEILAASRAYLHAVEPSAAVV